MMVIDLEAVTTGWSLISMVAGALMAAGAGWSANRATVGQIAKDMTALTKRLEAEVGRLSAEIEETVENIREDQEEDRRRWRDLESEIKTRLSGLEGRTSQHDVSIGVIMERQNSAAQAMAALGTTVARMDEKLDRLIQRGG